jgi:hypothetical protein
MNEKEFSNIRIYQRKTPPIDDFDRKDLEVVRYKNYGNTITSEDGSTLFFWSFYQLNNHTVIGLKYTESTFNGKNINTNLNFFLSRSYKFNYNFWEYWKQSNEENNKRHKKIREIKFRDEEDRIMFLEMEMGYNQPYENEKQCVEDFFYNKIEKIKYVKTDLIEINNTSF